MKTQREEKHSAWVENKMNWVQSFDLFFLLITENSEDKENNVWWKCGDAL